MGLTGVRLSVALIRIGLANDSGELARELRRRSGLDEVRQALLTQFTERSDLLKAQAALLTVERILDTSPVPEADALRARVESILAGAHELVELRLLNDLRTGAVELPDAALSDEAEVLLGLSRNGVPYPAWPAPRRPRRGRAPGAARRLAPLAAARGQPGGRRRGPSRRSRRAPDLRGAARSRPGRCPPSPGQPPHVRRPGRLTYRGQPRSTLRTSRSRCAGAGIHRHAPRRPAGPPALSGGAGRRRESAGGGRRR